MQGDASWQGQQRVPAFLDAMAATVLMSHQHTSDATRDKLKSLLDTSHALLKEEAEHMGTDFEQHHKWGVSFEKMKACPKSEAEAEMEALAAAGPDSMPSADNLPPEMREQYEASMAMTQGYNSMRRGAEASEAAYMAELQSGGEGGADGGASMHERAHAAASTTAHEMHARLMQDPTYAATHNMTRNFAEQVYTSDPQEQARLVAQAGDATHSVPELQKHIAEEQQRRQQQQQQQEAQEQQAAEQPAQATARATDAHASSEQPTSPLGADKPGDFTFQAPGKPKRPSASGSNFVAKRQLGQGKAGSDKQTGAAGNTDAADESAADAVVEAGISANPQAALPPAAGAWMFFEG